MKTTLRLAVSLGGLCAAVFSYAAEVLDLRYQSPLMVYDLVQPPQLSPPLSPNKTQTEEIRLTHQETDEQGILHRQYLEYFGGVPIWGQQAVIHQKDNVVHSLNGNLIKNINADISTTQPQITEIEAIEKAKTIFQTQNPTVVWHYQYEKAVLMIYVDKAQKAHLTYLTSFLANRTEGDKTTRPHFFVDASSGAILKQWEGLTNAKIGTGPGGNVKLSNVPYEYGTDFDFLDVQQVGNTCLMQTTDIKTKEYFSANVFSYPCPRNTYTMTNGAFAPLNDAHFFGQQVFNLYKQWYGIPPLPYQLSLNVHIPGYDNAYWDGHQVVFGDGNIYFHPLVSLDLVSHEIAHGFTEFHAGLVRYGQPGGINEAFSDMAGEAAEFYVRGHNDWEAGTDITKVAGPLQGEPLRYLCDPPKDGLSIDHADDYVPGMDVHFSSGVFNKAFCILAHKAQWDTQKAFDVMVQANHYLHWSPTSSFLDAACGAEVAAQELNYPVSDVHDAFVQVGLDCQPPTPATPSPLINGSFETEDYTGWHLSEDSTVPDAGTWGIAQDGQTITLFTMAFDFYDQIPVMQLSPGLPYTYRATHGRALAYQLQNAPENHRMSQVFTLSECTTTLSWDMEYTNHAGLFDPIWQFIAVYLRDVNTNAIRATLFKTTQDVDPQSIGMTRFTADVSAFAGETVRLEVEMQVQNYHLDAAFDNFSPQCETLTKASCQIYAVQDLDLNDSQFFTFLNDLPTLLGPLYADHDIESIDIHPVDHVLYASSGHHVAAGNPPGHLYQIDAQTGVLYAIGAIQSVDQHFKEVDSLSFNPKDSRLWGWVKEPMPGLIEIIPATGSVLTFIPATVDIEDLTWDMQGQKLYGAQNTTLWVYDGELYQHPCPLPSEAEALEMVQYADTNNGEAFLLIGLHEPEMPTILGMNLDTCEIIMEIAVTDFDDVEGISYDATICEATELPSPAAQPIVGHWK